MTNYIQQWKDFGRLRRNMMLLALGTFWMPAAAMLSKLAFPSIHVWTAMNLGILMLLWVTWIRVVVNLESRIALWPCPRCAEPFCGGRTALRELRSWSLSPAQCTHCGLQKNAEVAAE